ncbi:phosphopantothenoylcysteine decarboxylase [Anaerotalea alkaliphila]|uniref:DNA/pantothenate metabolism flavoprotein C-terminal domain-containing protein n=1 Tax=Anaerotalea alkaliphila TaxID=2662126 RepID=A0A7X5HT71_9FIRM|nr:phosphopantothenoylcysteine decarboxylase [Anaerotalea alkaliphila]NDL66230.1 hypothetical protein [Anaerotalea alkaliphila]
MKHLIITAGGTEEPIDRVRGIVNKSTGRVGAQVYRSLAAGLQEKREQGWSVEAITVHYVHGESAMIPAPVEGLPVVFYPVADVKSTLGVLKRIMDLQRVDFVVHAMAVSDFARSYLVEKKMLVDELYQEVMDKVIAGKSGKEIRQAIQHVMDAPKGKLDPDGKVPSDSDLFLSLDLTPKLIHIFKKINPDLFLVGFKLLQSGSEEQLVEAAVGLAERNGCDLVLANNLDEVGPEKHKAILVEAGRVKTCFNTKEGIGDGIAAEILERL